MEGKKEVDGIEVGVILSPHAHQQQISHSRQKVQYTSSTFFCKKKSKKIGNHHILLY